MTESVKLGCFRDIVDLYDFISGEGIRSLSFPFTAYLEIYRSGHSSSLLQQLRPLCRAAGIGRVQIDVENSSPPFEMTINKIA